MEGARVGSRAGSHHLVIAGLDPAIQRFVGRNKVLDARVKPAHDEAVG
jgi:hypothetical protein